MSTAGQVLPLDPRDGGGRYPGFDVMGEQSHWDDATRDVVAGRLGDVPDIRFFTPDEVVTATALTDQILHQQDSPRIEVVNLIDERLHTGQTDGYQFASMGHDSDAWRKSLEALDTDARQTHGAAFHELSSTQRDEMLARISGMGNDDWFGMPAGRVWSLWTRYACSAFYSHPWAWQEIGFAGPAYPRGYKNRRPDSDTMHGREPFEVADARPGLDPVHPDREPRPILQPSGRHRAGHRRPGQERTK